MNVLFQKCEIQKIYWAIIEEWLDLLFGYLVYYIDKDCICNVVYVFVCFCNKDVKKFEFDYELIVEVGNYYLFKVNLLIGCFY